jgi:hypothetical protein
MLFLVSCSTKSEIVSTDNKTSGENVNLESKEKKTPYKVLGGAPTVKYNVYKKGLGNKILFEGSFPKGLEMYFTNGKSCTYGKHRGVEYVDFPITCTFYCPTINTNNWNSDMAQQLNDFKIEFYEPGNWYVVFHR